ncbi:PAS domain-containing sensor histidine kinase [Zobellia uliginosa]|uniref:PAS domain-containing sensor histidine kinase n=1 Tax=Zobellia uliginosa TaxID=143224 RepID=UPI001C07D565|nr:PAS domain S-box protein [Zobellia uliginosa]MBU2945476.1 PAS domain S-box protein [Zobellia uliginosa]
MGKTTKKKSKIPYHKIFIEQAPSAIAMFDREMCYLAVSDYWINEYSLYGVELIGQCHYDIFPEITEDSKQLYQECINKELNVFDEIPFKFKDGTLKWHSVNIQPWYITKNEVGGLFIHTIDITPSKEEEFKKARTKEIFAQTKETAKIGTWEANINTRKVYWSTMVRKIHEVSENYIPTIEDALNYYEEHQSRPRVTKIINDALDKGFSFDFEAKLITAKDNYKWVRVVGKPEIIDGNLTRVFGIIQDISEAKSSRNQLNKAYAQLRAVYNSESTAIFSTDSNGVINHFNKGAELLLGYTASEMEGKETPLGFLLIDEVNTFRQDLALQYGKNPEGFSHYKDLTNEDVNDTREWTYVCKDGSTLSVMGTVSAVKNELGNNIGYIAVSTDISEIKQYQNELLAKNELLNFAERLTVMGHWQWNPFDDIAKWSKSLFTILEMDETENLSFSSFLNFVHPDDQQMVSENIELALKDKKFTSFTTRMITTKGKIRTIHLAGVVLTNSKGEVLELMGTGQDITEITMAEKKLRGLLESAPDAIIIVNEQGYIQLINKQTETLFQYEPEELLKQSVENFIPNLLAPIKAAKFSNVATTRQIGVIEELVGLRKNGQKIPISITMGPVEWEDELVVSLGIRDITKQKEAARKILKSKENLELLAHRLTEQNRQLADFTHITSHNLRAPVSNLNSLLEIYKTTDSHAIRESLFEKFETVINHLSLTLNTLIEALKSKGPHSEEDIQEIRFEDIFNSVKDVLAGEILKSGVSIKTDFSKCPIIEYHKIYLDSIFLNLIGNSIKYKSKERKPEIEIESFKQEGKIMLEFRDNGLGIDLEQHGHKLFGLNKVFHRHPDAKGVGLFLTKSQIEAMGGTIYATSKVDVGTTFTINF